MKTPKDILIELRDIIPYRIDLCLDPYIEEAMEIYAKQYHDHKVNNFVLDNVVHPFCTCDNHKYSETEKCTECGKRLPPF